MGGLVDVPTGGPGLLRGLGGFIRDVGFPVVVAVFVLWRIDPALRELVLESGRQTVLLEMLVSPECQRKWSGGSWSLWPEGHKVCAALGPGAIVWCVGEDGRAVKMLKVGEG